MTQQKPKRLGRIAPGGIEAKARTANGETTLTLTECAYPKRDKSVVVILDLWSLEFLVDELAQATQEHAKQVDTLKKKLAIGD